ncbi:MAG: hypothetical protein DWQ07_17470 [Chloroflexi bacterium]|nr:MAG: hypothetical protein DWQ07_17470 [Chloroflexota bacterium]
MLGCFVAHAVPIISIGIRNAILSCFNPTFFAAAFPLLGLADEFMWMLLKDESEIILIRLIRIDRIRVSTYSIIVFIVLIPSIYYQVIRSKLKGISFIRIKQS